MQELRGQETNMGSKHSGHVRQMSTHVVVHDLSTSAQHTAKVVGGVVSSVELDVRREGRCKRVQAAYLFLANLNCKCLLVTHVCLVH